MNVDGWMSRSVNGLKPSNAWINELINDQNIV